ncbi:MAG: O-antigen ligase family protein [Chloroflexi bacterium]|nr:O-antigen ligase family protein [Chloroflexota bacterium]
MSRQPQSSEAPSLTVQLLPALDIGLAVLAGAIWYIRPQEGAWPLALIGVAWLLRTLAYGSPTRPTPFDLPMVIFLASAFASATVGYNQDPRWADGPTPLMWAWAKYWTLVAAVALFFAVANLRTPSAVRGAALGMFVLAVAISIYFVLTNDWGARGGKVDALSQIGAWLAEPAPEIAGRRLNPNVAGGIIALAVPFGIVVWIEARRRIALRILWSIALAIAGAGLLLSASRGAWLALAVALLGWALARQFSALRQNRSVVRAALLALTLICVGVVLGTAVDRGSFGSLPVAAPAGVSGFGSGSVIGRVTLWQGGIGLAQDYIFTGAGLGALPMQISAYALLLPVLYVPHVHNTFLNILIEQGLPGAVALIWLLLVAIVASWRATRNSGNTSADQSRRLMREAALVSLAVMLLHGLVDDVPFGSRGMLLLFVPLGMIAALHGGARSAFGRLPLRVIAIAAALLFVTALWQRDAIVATAYANLGALAQSRAELAGYRVPDRLPETLRREAPLDEAIAAYRQALALDPGNRTANQRMGMIALARGQYDAAMSYIEAAYRRDPANETLRMLMGDAALAAGRADDAYTFWVRAPDAPSRLELTASLRYDKLNDLERAAAARALAARIASERSKGH